jgi:hypothetical protein
LDANKVGDFFSFIKRKNKEAQEAEGRAEKKGGD